MLKGVIAARPEHAGDMRAAITEVAEEIDRQVKRTATSAQPPQVRDADDPAPGEHERPRRLSTERGRALRAAAPTRSRTVRGGGRIRAGPWLDSDHGSSRQGAEHRRGQAVPRVREARLRDRRLRDRARARSDAELRERIDELRERPRTASTLDDVLERPSRSSREAGRRTMGMRHFDVQLDRRHGAARRQHRRDEDRRGQDAHRRRSRSCLNALAGKGVHVVTVNDYLARRDAEWMSPIYDAARPHRGASCRTCRTYEDKQRAYAADITYGTNSEFGFDYLRDNMAQSLEEKVQHGGRIGEDGRPVGDAQLRDRRRGRQHPHRRGAHAADHLRRARAGRRPLREVRQARAADGGGQDARRAWTRGPRRSSSPTSTTSSTRSTRRSRSPSRASRRPSGSSASTTSTAPRTATSSTT